VGGSSPPSSSNPAIKRANLWEVCIIESRRGFAIGSMGELSPEPPGLSLCGVCGREIAGDTTADMTVGR
jgi:hypothetical protein